MGKKEFLKDVNNAPSMPKIKANEIDYEYEQSRGKEEGLYPCLGQAIITYKGKIKTYSDTPEHAISAQFVEDYMDGFWTKIYRAMDVANWFVQNAIEEKQPIDQLQLHKILYYAHAWWLGFGYGNLFDEPVEAWDYGPVVSSLYPTFSEFGKDPIKATTRKLRQYKNTTFDEGTESHLEGIWYAYEGLSGIELMNMTHETGEAWRDVYNANNGVLLGKPMIPNALIEKIYKKKAKKIHDENK